MVGNYIMQPQCNGIYGDKIKWCKMKWNEMK